MKAAQSHANDMACNQLFGHTGSDGSTVASRVAASGYKAASSTSIMQPVQPIRIQTE
jgi:uncharacterized protein YkwD